VTGFYKMFRGWMQNPALLGDPYCRCAAWVWLVEEAAWAPRRRNIKGRTVELRRGQLTTSTRFLAAAWGWPETTVRRFLTRLKTDAMIGAESGAGQLVITICNYDKYQALPDQGGAVDGAASGAEAAQKRRKLEGRKERNTLTVDQTAMRFQEFWRAYPSREPHANPNKPAHAKFDVAVKGGTDPEVIIRGAENYAAYVRQEGTDPKYVAQAVTWLSQKRWTDYQAAPEPRRAAVGMC